MSAGDAIRSAGQTFFSVLGQLREQQRMDRREAREVAESEENARWRRATMAMQEAQNKRQQESHEGAMKQLGMQLDEMEREQAETAQFVDQYGMSPEQWAQMAEMEKFELYKEMQALTKRQIEVNISATQAARAYQARSASLAEADAARRAQREEWDFQMDKAEFEDFQKNKGLREAGQVLGVIQDQLKGVNSALSGYQDQFGNYAPDTPVELLQARDELSQLQAQALSGGTFSDEIYKRMGIDRSGATGSIEPETEEARLQRMYGAGGAAARSAASAEERKQARAAAAAAQPKNSAFFYIDEQGLLQGTNDAAVVSALEKTAPERLLDERFIHKSFIGKPYAPRRGTRTVGSSASEAYLLPDPLVPLGAGFSGLGL